MSEWMLAQLKPNADAIAKRNLERQGFGVFQPMERRTRVRRGRFVTQTRGFFPGYAFLNHPADCAPWSLVNSTYGVARLVRFGDRPAPVPEHVITSLRAACDENEIISNQCSLFAGAEVAIRSGVFSGFIGKLERLSPNDRALVLIDFMGKRTSVEISGSHLLQSAIDSFRSARRA